VNPTFRTEAGTLVVQMPAQGIHPSWLARPLAESGFAPDGASALRVEAAGDWRWGSVEADISAGVRAVPLSEFNGQRARIVRPLGLNETDRQRLADWLVSHIGAPYDLALAWALTRRFLKLPTPRAMVQDKKRFICSSLLAQAFLFVGYPIVDSQTSYVVPRDFESAAGFEVVTALG